MANNIYIGNRYVPVFANPVEWDNLREYEPLTIVTYNGTAYTSKQTVPVGTALNNTDYWVVTGNYNAQVEEYRQTVEEYRQTVENLGIKINNLKIYNVKDYGAKGNDIDDDTEPILKALNDANLTQGILFFPSGIYKINKTLQINSQVHVLGSGVHMAQLRYLGNGALFNVDGGEGNKIGITIDELSAIGNDTNSFLNIINGRNIYVNNIIGSNFKTGIDLSNCGNSYFNNIFFVLYANGSIGINHGNGSVSNNYSNIAIGCFNGAVRTSYGFLANTGNIADFTINYMDVAGALSGITINGNQSSSLGNYEPADIRLNNVVTDGCLHGVEVYNLGRKGNCVINCGWLNNYYNEDVNVTGITIVNSDNVLIDGVTFQQIAANLPTYWYGITASDCNALKVVNNNFINLKQDVSVANINFGVFNNNTSKCDVSNNVPRFHLNNCSGCTICGNTINVIGDVGVYASGKNIIANNIVKTTTTGVLGDDDTILSNNIQM